MAAPVLLSVGTKSYRAASSLRVVVREEPEGATLGPEVEVHVTAEVPVAVRGIWERVGTACAVQCRRPWRCRSRSCPH
jgi:hypothetical protein